MKHLTRLLFLFVTSHVFGATAETFALSKDPVGWKQVEVALATKRFVPADDRNAAVLITLIGDTNGRIATLPALKKLHVSLCQRFLPAPNGDFVIKEIKLPHGNGYYSTFEDPDLIGKPPIKGNYKFTSPSVILFDTGEVINATIFADQREGKTVDEAMAILQSVDLKGNPAPGPGGMIRVASPDGELAVGLPNEGLVKAPKRETDAESYFSYARKDGLIISGWLEPAAQYKGFPKMWDSEKKGIEQGMKVKLQDEKLELINGWQTVSYAINLPGTPVQQNLRACQVFGHTWVDVHLSVTGANANINLLKDYLKRVVLLPARK